MNKFSNWWLRNSFLGGIFALLFGQNWIEEKPGLAQAAAVFLYLVLGLALLGFVLALLT